AKPFVRMSPTQQSTVGHFGTATPLALCTGRGSRSTEPSLPLLYRSEPQAFQHVAALRRLVHPSSSSPSTLHTASTCRSCSASDHVGRHSQYVQSDHDRLLV